MGYSGIQLTEVGTWGKTAARCICLVFLLCPAVAFAHKITFIAYQEKNSIFCESFYEDGRPVADGSIKVLTNEGVVILTGKTDLHGMFQFPYQGVGDLQLTLQSHMGHSTSIVFNGQTKNQTTLSDQAYSKPKLSKIVVGICIIFGLFGITAYLMSQKNSND
nr:hypothetical protein [Desulfobulbaceae bacterium]